MAKSAIAEQKQNVHKPSQGATAVLSSKEMLRTSPEMAYISAVARREKTIREFMDLDMKTPKVGDILVEFGDRKLLAKKDDEGYSLVSMATGNAWAQVHGYNVKVAAMFIFTDNDENLTTVEYNYVKSEDGRVVLAEDKRGNIVPEIQVVEGRYSARLFFDYIVPLYELDMGQFQLVTDILQSWATVQ